MRVSSVSFFLSLLFPFPLRPLFLLGFPFTFHVLFTFKAFVLSTFFLLPSSFAWVGGKVENIKVFDFEGRWFSLLDFAKGRKFVLSPIYTKCPSACSIITFNLKEALSKMKEKHTVLSFSFDEKDTVDDLLTFARRWELDGRNWTVVSARKEDIIKLLDSLGFWIKRVEGGEILHPNLIYVVDGKDSIILAVLNAKPLDFRSLKIALSDGNIIERFIFFRLFSFDPVTRKYEFDIIFLSYLVAFGTIILILIFLRYILFGTKKSRT